MSRIALSGNALGTGTFTIASPNSNTDRTLNLPDNAGTILTSASALAAANLSGRVPAANAPLGSVIQVQSTTAQGMLSTTANGDPSTITNGVQVFSLSFTPISATSTILVQTSSVAVSESSNGADMCWLALWNGSSFVAANSGTWLFNHFVGNLNAAYISINESFPAGTTAARTIQVRAAVNGSGFTTYVNGNASANFTGTSAQIRMTVWEIAA
jgi:hypothetical protein